MRARARPCSSPPTSPTGARACSARCGSRLGRELGLVDEDALALALDHRLPDVRAGPRTRAAGRPCTIPFTRPAPESEPLLDKDPGRALRGRLRPRRQRHELGGGSFRIHEPELQAKVFDILRSRPRSSGSKFGFLLDALAMGAPPHGGIAFGIDRMMMVLAREPNLRDTIAFPKNQAGVDPMSGAPTDVPTEQLAELGIQLTPEPKPTAGISLPTMPTAFAPRFVLEAAFLVLLAVAVGLADLEPF